MKYLNFKIYLIYSLVINLIAFLSFARDKSKARKGLYRTPEAFFHGLSLLGGGTGIILALILFHHKLSKKSFYLPLLLIFLLNKFLLAYVHLKYF